MVVLMASMAGAHAYDHRHEALAEVLRGVVHSDGVDYEALRARRPQLRAYLDANANAAVKSFTREQKIAFYANTYNALTLDLIVSRDPLPASIRDLDGGKVWQRQVFPVGRERVTLDQIENQKLRPLTDGRIHAVLNCASKGCAPLAAEPLRPDELERQLEEAARRWVHTTAMRLEGDTLFLSRIFQWYAEDFTGMPKGTASDDEMKRAARRFIEARRTLGPVRRMEWMEYDWSLNRRD